jgi:hypothetical protein
MSQKGVTLNTMTGGDIVGADDIGGVKFQRVKVIIGADGVNDGDLAAGNPLPVLATAGKKPTWIVQTGNQVNVAAARTTHFDIFNASGSGKVLRVLGIYIIPTLVAVTGVGLTWDVIRTSAVGTGGVALTPKPFDSANAALPAGITARGKPTGGATTSITWFSPNTSSEETVPYASLASVLNHIPVSGGEANEAQRLVLHEDEGLKIDQTTSSNVGSTNCVVVFTVE